MRALAALDLAHHTESASVVRGRRERARRAYYSYVQSRGCADAKREIGVLRPAALMKQWLLGVVLLASIVLVFNTHLLSYGSVWCDQRVQQLSAEKDKSVRQALDQMHEALSQQDASVEALQAERATSRALRKKLAKLAKGDDRLQRLLKLAELEAAKAAGHKSSSGGNGGSSSSGGGSHSPHAALPLEDVSPPPPPPALLSALAGSTAVGAPALVASRLVPSAMAVVVIAYNRPQYLDRALRSIFAHHPGGDAFPVYVSQDGEQPGVASVIEKHGARRLVHPRQQLRLKPGTYLSKFPGYAYLAVHYGWALRTLFEMNGAARPEGGGHRDGPFQGVIILEEDIEVAPDFWSYFTHTAPLLEADPSLLCVSAFNDNGQNTYRGEPSALHRSDFFPGLGWLVSRRRRRRRRRRRLLLSRRAAAEACCLGAAAPRALTDLLPIPSHLTDYSSHPSRCPFRCSRARATTHPLSQLTRNLWKELGPKWPNEAGFWDDWLREAPQRRGRASIRPEVSRTFTFGAQGTSVGLFYRKYLANIELNGKPGARSRPPARPSRRGRPSSRLRLPSSHPGPSLPVTRSSDP